VDTLIVIPNQNLFRVANERTTFAEAFGLADQVLHSGVRSITDLMVLPGLINLDFADVRAVMTEMGKAMMGTGEAGGDDRALMAAQNAIANPLLDEVSLKGAKAVLINVTGGLDMTLLEVDEAANAISEQVDDDANIIFGAAFDPSLQGMIRVSVVATGMDGAAMAGMEPKMERAPIVPPVLRAPPFVQEPAPAPEPVRSYERPYPERPAFAPAPEPVAYAGPAAAPASQPEIIAPYEPVAAMERAEQGDLLAAAPAPTAAPAPQISRPVARIVDPAVEDMEDEPMFAPHAYEDRRPQRGGFLSLFGSRQRYEPAPPAARHPVSRGGALPAETPAEEPLAEGGEDLEIPSFLRRLAN
jgi:cell division protein FtsZ